MLKNANIRCYKNLTNVNVGIFLETADCEGSCLIFMLMW
jgi:hypothetical protein